MHSPAAAESALIKDLASLGEYRNSRLNARLKADTSENPTCSAMTRTLLLFFVSESIACAMRSRFCWM